MADLVQKIKPQDVDDILDEIEQNEKKQKLQTTINSKVVWKEIISEIQPNNPAMSTLSEAELPCQQHRNTNHKLRMTFTKLKTIFVRNVKGH